jgi:hypothetical protein
MSKKRRPVDGIQSQQQSLLDYIRSLDECRRSSGGSEGTLNIRERLRRSLNRAIKESGLSRAQIAGEMSHLLSVDVTKSVIDAWTAESKGGYRIPAEYLPAFCRATRNNQPIEILTEAAGMFSLPGPDALRAEIQKWNETARRARAEVRKRELFLEEMNR